MSQELVRYVAYAALNVMIAKEFNAVVTEPYMVCLLKLAVMKPSRVIDARSVALTPIFVGRTIPHSSSSGILSR